MIEIRHRYDLPEDGEKRHAPWVTPFLLASVTFLLALCAGTVTVLVMLMSALLVAAQ